MESPLEAIPPVDPQPPTLAEVAAKPEFSLKEFRAVQSGEKTAAVLEPPAAVPDATGTTEPVETQEQAEQRARDEKGRFTKAEAKAEPVAEPEDDETKPPQTVSQFQKRINREVAKRAEWERRYHELATKQTAAPEAPKPDPPPPPIAAKFPSFEAYAASNPEATYEDYIDARAEARIEARLSADRQRAEADQRTHVAAGAMHKISTLGQQTHADFGAVVQAAFDAGIRWPQHVTEFVLRHTESAEEAVSLTYALAKDHALAHRISALPPGRAVYELGKLTASLPSGSRTAAGSVPTPSPVTKAPAPIQPVGTSATASAPSLQSVVAGTEISLKRLRALQR